MTKSTGFPLTVAVLTWDSPETLERTLASYEPRLTGLAAEVLVWCQGRNPEELEIVRRHGFEALGTDENIGIGPAYSGLLEASSQTYTLFLECDWRLVSRRTHSAISDATELLERGTADVARLRSRSNPGSPLWFLEYQNRELDHPASVLDSVYWERHPDRIFDQVSRVDGLRHTWFCALAPYAGWTNNPHLARTDWLRSVLAPFSGSGGIGLEHTIEAWWARQPYRVAQGPGLFTHDRRDGPGHQHVTGLQRVRNRTRLGTRLRAWRRPTTTTGSQP